MTHLEQMLKVEERAHALRLTMSDVLRFAGVAHSTWSRAKARGYIRASTIGRVEAELDAAEKRRAEQETA